MHMRLHINIDDDLAREIDELAGPRNRSRYIREAIAARVEVDRKVAARRRLVGSIPDFAPGVTAQTISEERKRETLRREAKLAPHWRRD